MAHRFQLDFDALTLPETAHTLGISAARAQRILDAVGDGNSRPKRKMRKRVNGRVVKKHAHARKSR